MSELLAGQKDHGQVDDEASVEVQISSKEEEQDVGNGKSAKRGHRRNLSMQVGELLMSEKDAAAKLGISVTYDEEKAKAKAMAVEVETTQGDVDESGEAQNSEESGKAVSNASGIKVSSSTLPPIISSSSNVKKENPFKSDPSTAGNNALDDSDDSDSDDEQDNSASNAPVLSRDSLFSSMWSQNSFFPPSSVDGLLDNPECTLEDILLEDEVFQELRRSNAKLIAFLLKPDVLVKVIDYTIIVGEHEQESKVGDERNHSESKVSDTMQKGQKFDSGMVGDALDPTTLLRYSLVSCAILCSDVGSINDIMFESVSIRGGDSKDKESSDNDVSKRCEEQVVLLERLFSALENDNLPSRVSSNIEKVVETLLLSKRSKFLEWLNGCKKCLALFIKHIDVKSISEIFRKILHFADGGDINSSGDGPGLNLWSGVDHKSQDEGSKSPSNEHPIVESLIARLVQENSDSTTYLNILATITDMIERSTGEITFMMMQRGEEPKNIPTRLMMGLDTYAQAHTLLQGCIDGWKEENKTGSRCRLQVLCKWLLWVSHSMSKQSEQTSNSVHSDPESDATNYDGEDEVKNAPPLVRALLTAVPFFCSALEFKEKELVPAPATYGMDNGKIGVLRLELVDLLCTLSCVPHAKVAQIMAKNSFMGKCFEIFLRFEWCNIAHSKITSAIISMLNDIDNAVCVDVYESFFLQYDVIKHVLDAYILNDEKKKERHYESGYMGHLHVIAASIVETAKVLKSMGVKPGNKTAGEVLLKAIEQNDESNEWSVFVDTKLQEVIAVQTKALGNDSNYKAVASPKLSPKEFAAFVKDDLDLLESESRTTDGAKQNNDSIGGGKTGDSDQSTAESDGSKETVRELVLDQLNFE